MGRTLAIARLAFQEGLRMKIVLVFLVVLIFLVLRLPFALRGDETLSGRLQNFLAYSLGAVSIFMSLATVFFSCATLSLELRSSTLHLVVTKPVRRLEILAGKWIGVNLLNVLLVALCGLAIYGFARFIAAQPKTFERDRLKITDVVWTARAAASPVRPDLGPEAEAYVRQRIREGALAEDRFREALDERLRVLENVWRSVPPGETRLYQFENLVPPEREDAVVQVRFRAIGIPPPDDTIAVGWLFVDPQTQAPLMPAPLVTEERSGETHQFLVRAEPVIREGRAALVVINPARPDASTPRLIHFEGPDSLQILYKVGSFEVNYIKALLLILVRLGFLSALGLFFSTFVSFPVACLCTFTVFLLGMGRPWWEEAIGAHLEVPAPEADPFGRWGPMVRAVLLPVLRAAFPLLSRYQGGTALVDGTYIPWLLVGESVLYMLVAGLLVLLVGGGLIFQRREVAEVQL